MATETYEIKELKLRIRNLEATLHAAVAIAVSPATEDDYSAGHGQKDDEILASRQAALLAAHNIAPSYGAAGPTERTTISDLIDDVTDALCDVRRAGRDAPAAGVARAMATALVNRAFGLASLTVSKLAPNAVKAAIATRRAATPAKPKPAKKKPAKPKPAKGTGQSAAERAGAHAARDIAQASKTSGSASTPIPSGAAPPAKRKPGRPPKASPASASSPATGDA